MANGSGYYSRFFSTFSSLRKKTLWRDSSGVLLGLNLMSAFHNPDAIDQDFRKASQLQEQETGAHRLKLMFSYDEYGNISPELHTIVQGTMFGAFTGSIIGGTIHSKENFTKFIEKNQGTAFANILDAQKQLQTKVTLGFARGAWMWGWRLGLFCGSFMLLSTTISVYRGKPSVLEYLAAGSITGSLYKLKQGPRAIVAGGMIGGALGTLAGCINLAILYITGTSMEEVRYWQYEWKKEYQEKTHKAIRKVRSDELDALTKFHEETVSTEGLLDAIDGQDANITK
ncbi:hypothetical protein OTU49_009975 [Cherax quadricarinatus]|uniref:Complex I assembly factor TIMMDC1, mitochondrial n=1 Tax=Cherax quadricarinatus TaxID=27406 RepID=A0AAW0WFS0_CHEQU|nr:RPII140-upstream gene protein-like [Cherax quadricarinatus]